MFGPTLKHLTGVIAGVADLGDERASEGTGVLTPALQMAFWVGQSDLYSGWVTFWSCMCV